MWQGGDIPLEQVGPNPVGERRHGGENRKREKGERRRRRREKLHLIYKFYDDRTVGFCRRKRQSSPTRQGLRIETKIRNFRQAPRGRGFSYSAYF